MQLFSRVTFFKFNGRFYKYFMDFRYMTNNNREFKVLPWVPEVIYSYRGGKFRSEAPSGTNNKL